MRDGAAIYRKAFTEGLKPDADLTVSEWSDAYRMLSNKASAEPGPWRTDRTPYLKEIMDAMSANSAVQRVVFMAGAQLGKTEAINNIVGYMIAHAPGPALFVQPTIEMAKRLSKQRLDSLIYETPALSGLVAPPRSRDGDNTMFSKSFPGGILLLTGPIPQLACDLRLAVGFCWMRWMRFQAMLMVRVTRARWLSEEHQRFQGARSF